MPEGGFGARLPQELRKRPAGNDPTPANTAMGDLPLSVEARVGRMSEEQIQSRWTQLMDKKAGGPLTPDEESEAELLELQVARMRRQRSAGQAA